jgi:hypothetical protein
VIGEDLDPGSDNEDHQEQVEEVLGTHPDRQPNRRLRVRARDAGVPDDESLHRWHGAHTLRASDCGDQKHQADR